MNTADILASDVRVRTRRFFRNRNALIWVIVIPLLITCIVESIMPDAEDIGMVYIQDKDGDSTFAEMVKNRISQDYPVRFVDKTENTAGFIASIKTANQDTFTVVLVIPDDFDYLVLRYMSGLDFETQINADGLSFAADFIRTAEEDFDDGDVHIAVLTPNDGSNPISSGIDALNTDFSGYYSPCIILSLVLMIVSGLTVANIREEKDSGISASLVNSGYAPYIQAASLIIWGFVPSAIVSAIVCSTIFLFDPMVLGWWTVVGIALTSMVAVAFGLFMSELVKNGQSMAIASSSVLLMMMLLSGVLVPTWVLPDILVKISGFVPTSYLLDMFEHTPGASTDLLSDCLFAIGFVVVFFCAWNLSKRSRNE